jgi:hypothetical protein
MITSAPILDALARHPCPGVRKASPSLDVEAIGEHARWGGPGCPSLGVPCYDC